MARNIGALAGLPDTVPAITINRYCSSGLQAIAYGAEGSCSATLTRSLPAVRNR
ncbi:3-ketoacyl-CoA thiolase [Heyndrickxia coagulans]|nr:3-ketoacyl-CoA thiolase [Heyndrickxia coagulans]